MAESILTVPEAEVLAARLREQIGVTLDLNPGARWAHVLLDRIESDLAGLREALDGLAEHLTDTHGGCWSCMRKCDDAPRYQRQAERCSDGLRAVEALYPEVARG